MKPDEALGAIFVLEGVLVDIRPLKAESWNLLAQEADHPVPVMRPHMHDLPPEKLMIDVKVLLRLRNESLILGSSMDS